MTTKDEKEAAQNELHTYADGSQRVGTPPFPKLSPLEEAAKTPDGTVPVPAQPRPGQPTSGEADPVATDTSAEATQFRVEQQLTSDVLSGKSPDTPNPTTDSLKPGLANMITANDLEQVNPEPTAEDIERMARDIKPSGKIDATEEEKEAAALQVLRETKGAVATKPARKNAKKK